LLHPSRYYESIVYEDASQIRYDISHILYSGYTQENELVDNLNLICNVTFADGETLFYNFDDCTNTNNPTFNNTNSNLRCQNPNQAPVYGSDAANYYSANATAG
jgi:hypothetical protein